MKNNAEKIAAIVALVQMVKYYGVPHNFLPVFAMFVGGALGFVEDPTAQGIINGIFMGAVATGGYGIVKNSAQVVLKKAPNETLNPSEAEHDDYRGV